jgi:hypothetical protein
VIREDHIKESNQLDDTPDNDLPLELVEEMPESKIEKFLKQHSISFDEIKSQF